MTSDLHWVEIKGGIEDPVKETVEKKDSYSSDSLDEYCEENTPPDSDKSKESLYESSETEMSNGKSLSRSCSDISSVQDNTSHYSYEIVEETEALQTEDIKESVDIRISPRNSTVMSFDCSDNFYSEFSLVGNVEVKIPDINADVEKTTENLDVKIDHPVLPTVTSLLTDDIAEFENEEKKCGINIPESEKANVNDNDSILMSSSEVSNDSDTQIIKLTSKSPKAAINEQRSPKVSEYYATKVEITKIEKRTSSSVEKKIAEEIKELKQREEDLRIMREKLAKEFSEKNTKRNTDSEQITVSKAASPTPVAPTCDDKPVPKVKADADIEKIYVKACVFAVKRKDVSVKEDHFETTNKTSSAINHQESPVQREIRIAKEREEELKREREQALKSKLEMDSFISELSAAETDVDSALSICSDSSFDSVSKLAPLFPRTVSPETNNSNGISVYSSSAGSMCSLESLSQRERQNAGSLPTVGSSNGSILSPSPDSFCKPGYPFSTPKALAERRSKSIDMERFISSKGKEIKFKGDSGNVGYTSSYYEIKPPQVKKGEEMTCKRFITAATKIQNELKEMQEREEQFK